MIQDLRAEFGDQAQISYQHHYREVKKRGKVRTEYFGVFTFSGLLPKPKVEEATELAL